MTKENTIKIIDKGGRESLIEGRVTNMGFAFLKKLEDNSFETVHPISPCKDYLNDVVYCEHLKDHITVFGLSYSYLGIFNDSNRYMVIKMLDNQRGKKDEELLKNNIARLENNYLNIQRIINWVEDKLQVERTTIQKANDNMYLVFFNEYWTTNTYLISLFSLILRVTQFYNGAVEELSFFEAYKEPLDIALWTQAKPKLFSLLKGIPVIQKLVKATGSTVHGAGILSYKPPNI